MTIKRELPNIHVQKEKLSSHDYTINSVFTTENDITNFTQTVVHLISMHNTIKQVLPGYGS